MGGTGRGGSTVQEAPIHKQYSAGRRALVYSQPLNLRRTQQPSLTKGARTCTYSLFCHPGTTVRSPRIKASTLLAAT